MQIDDLFEKFDTDIPEYILKKRDDFGSLYSREDIMRFKNEIKDYHFLTPSQYSYIIKGFGGDYSGFYKLETYMQNLLASDFYYNNYDLWIEKLNTDNYDVQSPHFKRMIRLVLSTKKEKERMLPFINNLDRCLIGKRTIIELYCLSVNKTIEEAFSSEHYLAAYNIDDKYNDIISEIQNIIYEFKKNDETFLNIEKADGYKERIQTLANILSNYLNENWNYRNLYFRFAYISKECLEIIFREYEVAVNILGVLNDMQFKRVDQMNKKQVRQYYDDKHELFNEINFAFRIMADKAQNYQYKMELVNSALIKPNSRYFITVENAIKKVAEFITDSKDMTKINEENEFLFLLMELSESCMDYIEYKDIQFSEKKSKDKKRSIKGFRRYTMAEAINCYCKHCISLTKTYIKLISDIDYIEKNGTGTIG